MKALKAFLASSKLGWLSFCLFLEKINPLARFYEKKEYGCAELIPRGLSTGAGPFLLWDLFLGLFYKVFHDNFHLPSIIREEVSQGYSFSLNFVVPKGTTQERLAMHF